MLEQTVDKLLWQGKAVKAVNLARLHALASPKDSYAWLSLGKAQAITRYPFGA